MFIVVVGGGRVGATIADFFARRGDKVVIIDRKREVCDYLSRTIDAVVYCGDARSTRLLRDAEVDKADVLYAVTDSDSINLRVAEIVKKNFGVPRVVVRVNHSENCSKGEGFADVTVCLGENAINAFIEAVVSPEYKYLLRKSGNTIAYLRVIADSSLVGLRIQDVEKDGLVVALLLRAGVFMRPSNDTVLEADDEILVAGEEEKVASLVQKLYE